LSLYNALGTGALGGMADQEVTRHSPLKSSKYINKEKYILKNNYMEMVLLSYDENEYLKNIEEVFEQLEIKDMVGKRLKKYDPRNNVSWEKIKNIKKEIM
jgi:hypothetical protein